MQFPNARILIFTRVPRAGEVKTRLIPALGAQGACAFHATSLRHTLGRLTDAGLAPIELCVTPDTDNEAIHALVAEFDCETTLQQGDGLGRRMAYAAQQALVCADSVILIGTDVPLLNAAYMERALREMERGVDFVMGPAEDGGYVLLGLRHVYPELFSDMPWGSEQVAGLTRQRCIRLGKQLVELPVLWDVDRPEDLLRLCGTVDVELHELQALCQHLPRL